MSLILRQDASPCAFLIPVSLHSRPSLSPSFTTPTSITAFRMCQPAYRSTPRDTSQRARDFLTQRSVQHTMFCARVLRDETTVRWLEDFLGHNGLDDLHHCDALNVSSQNYLSSLLKEPTVVLQIKKPIPGRTNNTNPYITRRYFCYDVEIVPRNIARRVMRAREQIASELICDIPCIRADNYRSLELYRSALLDPTTVNQNPLNYPSNGDTGGSPYRSSNYDLVKNYTLYIALVATVKELSSSKRSAPDAQWLKSFLDTHYQSLIAPRAGTFGVADRLVTQILDTSPSIRDASELFDPRKLVDMIFHNRTKCADQWLQVMKLAEQEHLDLERELLEQSL